MLSQVKKIIRPLIPKSILNYYHSLESTLGALKYSFPSKELIIIGVTGTKGKSTVSHLLCHSLNNLGQSCGLISTALVRVGNKEWLNNLKMTMPGRFILQKFLRQMVSEGNKYAIVETSSEGIAQGRHLGIWYDAAIFTNLSPEHIESHGSFANYRQAKLKLWQVLPKYSKSIFGQKVAKVSVVNLDDPEASLFLEQPADIKFGYTLNQKNSLISSCEYAVAAWKIKISSSSINFKVNETEFNLPIGGRFNVYNALAVIVYLLSQKFSLAGIAQSMKDFAGTPGRLEFINQGQNFKVVVDYAHTPESLEVVYKTLKSDLTQDGKLISVLGSCGGGRDQAKRPILGKLAGESTDYVIVTNEDPYDEDPLKIIKAVAEGALASGKKENENLFIIPDRRQAIAYALSLARQQDVVIITGKGCEQWLVTKQGKISWDDRQVVREELNKILN